MTTDRCGRARTRSRAGKHPRLRPSGRLRLQLSQRHGSAVYTLPRPPRVRRPPYRAAHAHVCCSAGLATQSSLNVFGSPQQCAPGNSADGNETKCLVSCCVCLSRPNYYAPACVPPVLSAVYFKKRFGVICLWIFINICPEHAMLSARGSIVPTVTTHV